MTSLAALAHQAVNRDDTARIVQAQIDVCVSMPWSYTMCSQLCMSVLQGHASGQCKRRACIRAQDSLRPDGPRNRPAAAPRHPASTSQEGPARHLPPDQVWACLRLDIVYRSEFRLCRTLKEKIGKHYPEALAGKLQLFLLNIIIR